MTASLRRLQRLAHAQSELVKALEAALGRAERRAALISADRLELDTMSSAAGRTNPAIVPAMLQRLLAVQMEERQSQAAIETIRQKLLAAKIPEKALSERSASQRQVLQRAADDDDALETTLAMMTKASGKGGVVS